MNERKENEEHGHQKEHRQCSKQSLKNLRNVFIIILPKSSIYFVYLSSDRSSKDQKM